MKAQEAKASTDDTELDVTGTAQSRYEQLAPDRQHFVDRGVKCAELTLPTLFHNQQGSTSSLKIKDPTQSLGARGVNSLAAKMTLSLLPMNTPFFKMNVDMLALKEADMDEMKTEIEKGLSVIERGVVRNVENTGDVTAVFEALKHLAVVGNVLLFVGKNGTRLYDLNKYVVVRDPDGKVLEIVVCEETAPTSLPAPALDIVQATQKHGGQSNEKTVKVFTHIKFEGGRVKWHQEILGTEVPGSSSDVPEKGNPWLALRFMRVDGENYGRGYVEMYLGDLESLEVLVKALRDAAISASKVVWLVRPNGTTSPTVLAKAANNSVKSGDANDVTVLRMDKAADLRVAQETIQSLEGRLAYAFMISAEVLRDAERVTAEEVRFVAQELDDSLGGIYSILSKDFQLPYVKRQLHLMKAKGKMPDLPDIVEPVIVTGFAALGRGHDRDKLVRFAKTVIEMVGPEGLPQYVNVGELINRLAVTDGIETTKLMITADEREQQTQQNQASGMTQQLAPELIKQMGPQLMEQMKGTQDGAAPQVPDQQPQ